MERALLSDLTLEYDSVGSGDPVILIHGAFIAHIFRTLVAEPALSDRYRLITYARRGYAGSNQTRGPTTIAQHAADCRALLSHLEIERAHVVGHSLGGCIALQLALDAPEVVQSLTLLEPALAVGGSGPGYQESLLRAHERFRTAGAGVAVDESLEARWPGYRKRLEQALPGVFAQAVTDAQNCFATDLPALLDWSVGGEQARRLSPPVLAVLGGESNALSPRFGETHEFLLSSLPNAEGFVLPGVTHFLQVENPRRMAEVLSDFFARHPLSA